MKMSFEPPTTYASRLKLQVFNSFIRLLPMSAKFVLTLYMGRFFDLDDIGVYGLVAGTVAILNTTLGQRLDFIITRDIVDVEPETALKKMRDGFIFYGLNYMVLAVIIFILISRHTFELGTGVMLYILVLGILESLSALLNTNMVALNQQIAANIILFVRSGAWVIPVVLLGLFMPWFRSYHLVLLSWIVGVFCAIVLSFRYWRDMPWKSVMRQPVDWAWIGDGLKKSCPMWVGMIGLIFGGYVNRFVIEHYMTLDDVGILTFYFSFTNAMLTLMQSGVIVFAYPRLIAQHRDGDTRQFRKEVIYTIIQLAVGGTAIAAFLGYFVPLLAHLLGRESLVAHERLFWLLLIGTWLQVNAETFFYTLFARHQDKPLWLGNLLYIIPSLSSVLLVPVIGINGAGYSAILSNLFLLVWRLWYVRDLFSMKQPPPVEAAA